MIITQGDLRLAQIPQELQFTATHEWVRQDDDGCFSVGITDHAQELLGDLVFVELPPLGERYGAGQECCVVESVKAAADVYCPVSGVIEAANEALVEAPELINAEPYGKGWLFRLRPEDPDSAAALLDAAAYSAVTDEA